ncbi:MAG: hypothetical protein ACOYMB_01560 [Patescibacteria group bacterium]
MKKNLLVKILNSLKFYIYKIGKSLLVSLAASFIFSLLFIIINTIILEKSFTISTNQEYFSVMEKSWGWKATGLEIAGYWNFAFTAAWGFLVFGFAKLKFLERHELIVLPAINFFAVASGVCLSFYLNSICFGVVAYLAFILIFIGIIILLELSNIFWEILFPG